MSLSRTQVNRTGIAPICEVPHQSIYLNCLGDRKLAGGFLADTNYIQAQKGSHHANGGARRQ